MVSPERITIEKSLRQNFSATNNEAEYEALLIGMIMVQRMGGKAVRVFSYSKLVVGQVRGDLEAIQECKSTYAKSGAYKRNLRFLTCLMFLKVEIHMQIRWPPQPRPRCMICLEQYWLKTCIRILQHIMVFLGSTKSNWVRVGWILYRYSWKRTYCLRKRLKLTKYRGKLLVSGSPRIESYTSALSLVLTYFVCTPKHQNHFQMSFTKGFAEVIHEEDPCLTGLLPKDIGGQTC